MEVLLEILKYTVPALIVFFTVLIMIRAWSRNEDLRRKKEFNMHLSDEILPVRLQAYERSILLLERISPESMIMRVSRNDYSARQLQQTNRRADVHLAVLIYIPDGTDNRQRTDVLT